MNGLVEIYLEITFFSTFWTSMIVQASNTFANFVAEAKRVLFLIMTYLT